MDNLTNAVGPQQIVGMQKQQHVARRLCGTEILLTGATTHAAEHPSPLPLCHGGRLVAAVAIDDQHLMRTICPGPLDGLTDTMSLV